MFNLVRETWQLKGRTFQSKRKFASWVQNWKNSFSYRVWWRRHLNLLCILISGVSWPLVAVACFCRHVSRRLFSIIDYFILLASQNANAINMTSSLAELICNLNWSTRHTAQHTAHGTRHTAHSWFNVWYEDAQSRQPVACWVLFIDCRSCTTGLPVVCYTMTGSLSLCSFVAFIPADSQGELPSWESFLSILFICI